MDAEEEQRWEALLAEVACTWGLGTVAVELGAQLEAKDTEQ